MKIYDRKKLEEHLNECKSVLLKNKVLEFYENLQKANITLSEEDFEKLTVRFPDGKVKEYEQDAVTDLFQSRKFLPLEEYFVYQFINHVNKLEFSSVGFDPKKHVGLFYATDKKIAIYPHSISNHVYHYMQSGMSLEDAKKKGHEVIDDKYSLILNHELGHVLENKTFNRGEITQTGLKNVLYVRVGDKFADVNKTNEILDFADDKSAEFHKYKLKGSESISETINDIITTKLCNTYAEIDIPFPSADNFYLKKAYAFKMKDGTLSQGKYNLNFDVIEFFEKHIPNFNYHSMRLNSKKFIEQINRLQFGKNASNYNKKILKEHGIKDADTASPYDLICLNTGFAIEYYLKGDLDKANDFKDINKELLNSVLFSKNIEKN